MLGDRGPRDVSEFRYGGQIARGPTNLPESQQERWYHRFGCGRWLFAERDVHSNTVIRTGWLEEADSSALEPKDAS